MGRSLALAGCGALETCSMDLGLGGAGVVVGGGTKGMGRAAAECFAAEGARVCVLGRGQEAIDATVDALLEAGAPDAFGVSTDLTVASSVSAAFEVIATRWDGGLNVLVNAAGPVDVGVAPFEALDDDEWMATFDIGAMSAVRCIRAALPLLREAGWARIVNAAAPSTRGQAPGLIAYTAAKSAMTSLSKNLSLGLAEDGILVNTVSPGSFLSEGLKGYLEALPASRGVDPESLEDA